MREYDIDFVFCDLMLHKGFNGNGGLFACPPAGVKANLPGRINAVCSAYYKVALTFYTKDFSILSKQKIWKSVLYPNFPAVPLNQPIGGDMLRTALMIPMNAENRTFQGIQ